MIKHDWVFCIVTLVFLQGRYGCCRFLRDGYKTAREVCYSNFYKNKICLSCYHIQGTNKAAYDDCVNVCIHACMSDILPNVDITSNFLGPHLTLNSNFFRIHDDYTMNLGSFSCLKKLNASGLFSLPTISWMASSAMIWSRWEFKYICHHLSSYNFFWATRINIKTRTCFVSCLL